jgi:hypothetical protein
LPYLGACEVVAPMYFKDVEDLPEPDK